MSMNDSNRPLADLEEWEDFLKERYPEPQSDSKAFQAMDPEKKKEEFRNYEADARPSVREFYRLNHHHQTYDFVQAKRKEFLSRNRREMGVWEALEYLNTLVDDSDPDTDLSQLDHLLQTAEQIRRDGHPRWFVLTGLVHDLGKILCLYGEPQWAVVGDTFPVGCALGFMKRAVGWTTFACRGATTNIFIKWPRIICPRKVFICCVTTRFIRPT